jgi:hypothetical protein
MPSAHSSNWHELAAVVTLVCARLERGAGTQVLRARGIGIIGVLALVTAVAGTCGLSAPARAASSVAATCPPGERLWPDAPGCVPTQCPSGTTRDQDTGECITTVHGGTPQPKWDTFPADVVEEASSPNGAGFSFSTPTADIGGTQLAVSCDHASGEFPVGVTTVGCTASGLAGSFTVTIQDTTPPSVHVPADISLPATSASGGTRTFSASATDTVDVTDAATCSPSSGSIFPTGVTHVTCTATDHAGNNGSASFSITVTDPAPVIHVPGNQTATATGASGAAVSFAASASDIADGNDPLTCSPGSGSIFVVGTTTVTCSATNKAGEGAHETFTVTVSQQGPQGGGSGSDDGGPTTGASPTSPTTGTASGSGTQPARVGTCSTSSGNDSFVIGGCGAITAPSRVAIVVERQGNGTVTSMPPGIHCGTVCVGSFPPGTTVTLHIAPAHGFSLSHSATGCRESCRITVRHDQKLNVHFTALTREVSLTFSRLSVGQIGHDGSAPSLLAAGTLGASAKLALHFAPLDSHASSFTKLLSLDKGHFAEKLPLPDQIQAGNYLVTVSGTSDAGPVATFDRQLTIAGPPRGVIRGAWITATRNGSRQRSIRTAHTLWAYFSFSSSPPASARAEVTWSGPGGKASTTKPLSTVIETFAKGRKPTALPDGTWRCILSVNGKPVASASIRLG